MMTESTSREDPWNATLLQMQQELLQRWLKLSAAPAEVSGMFDWWSKLAATAESGVPPSFQQSGAAWELYFSLGRAVLQEVGAGDANAADPASQVRSFAAVMDAWFKQMSSHLGQLPNFRSPPDLQQWWQTLMHGADATAPGVRPKAAPTEFAALGLTRERQEAWQKFTRLLAHYQELQAKLARQWINIGAEATKQFAARVTATGGGVPGRSFDSIKGVYDLWIDCAEEVYGSVAHSPEYCQLISDLANSSNAVRAEQQHELESWARQFDLPTRAEVNSLHQQVKQLRAQLRAQTPPPPKVKHKRVVGRRPRVKK
jgi:Poly(R)-hydroxyalkanoic acid synthase subunit (PHA_synth_III_E)